MKKKDHKKVLLLAAVGVGAYLLYRNAAANAAGGLAAPGGTLSNSSGIAPGATSTGLDYSSDGTNTAKLKKWISGETNTNSQKSMTNFITTITPANRALLANYYDYITNGYNTALLDPATIPYLKTVATLGVGFHL